MAMDDNKVGAPKVEGARVSPDEASDMAVEAAALDSVVCSASCRKESLFARPDLGGDKSVGFPNRDDIVPDFDGVV